MINKIGVILLFSLIFWHPIYTQDCNSYYPIKEGTEWILESYNKHNEYQSKIIQSVKNSKKLTDGTITSQMSGKVISSEDQLIGQIDYEIQCKGGNYLISMTSLLNPEQMTAYKDMNVNIEGDFLEFPATLEPGMDLPPASVKVSIEDGTAEILNMEISIFDRKVEGIEQITTPAGTFECLKIVFTAQSRMGHAIPININTSGAEWLAPGTGMVRSEQYDDSQNLIGYSLLAAFKQ